MEKKLGFENKMQDELPCPGTKNKGHFSITRPDTCAPANEVCQPKKKAQGKRGGRKRPWANRRAAHGSIGDGQK